MQSILLRYLCSKMAGQQFTPQQRKFMVLSYHQTGRQVFKMPPTTRANCQGVRSTAMNKNGHMGNKRHEKKGKMMHGT